MLNVARGELRGHRLAGLGVLPEELGDGQQLVALHAFVDVNAVDAERGQL